MIWLLLLQLAAPLVYVPETIDSLAESTATLVQVKGTVTEGTALDPLPGGALKVMFRITDGHQHFLLCVFTIARPDGVHLETALAPPTEGQQVIVFGTRKVYPVEGRGPDARGAIEINPVVKIVPVESTK